MEGSWLDTFKGQHVTVLSGPEDRSDTGTLVRIGEGWLQMVKDNGDMILVPYSAIRIVKLLDMTQAVSAVQPEATPHISTRIYEPNAQTLP